MTGNPHTTIPEWTEGACGDGAVILRDGVPVPISELLEILNEGERLRHDLQRAMDMAMKEMNA